MSDENLSKIQKHHVMQWNTLADQYSQSFPKVDPQFLNWNHRRDQILQTIITNKPDLIGLQEVDHYPDFFEPALKSIGYSSRFFLKPDGKYGSGIFYNEDKYYLMDEKVVFFMTGQLAILVSLRNRQDPQKRGIIFVTTHLKAKKPFENVRVEQSKDLLFLIDEFNLDDWPVIISADMNTEPNGLVIPLFLQAGYMSAYPLTEGICTTIKNKDNYCARMIDYILFKGLSYSSHCPLPDPMLFGEAGLPAEKYPSDHLSLLAVLDQKINK